MRALLRLYGMTECGFAPDAETDCKNFYPALSNVVDSQTLNLLHRYFKTKPRPPKGFDEDEWERVMNAVVTTSLPQSSHSYRVNNKGWYKPIINSLREILPALSPDEQEAHIDQVLKRRWKMEKWVRALYLNYDED